LVVLPCACRFLSSHFRLSLGLLFVLFVLLVPYTIFLSLSFTMPFFSTSVCLKVFRADKEASSAAKPAKKESEESAIVLDEDDIVQYKKTMSRWARDALEDLADDECHAAMLCDHAASRTLIHAMCFMQSPKRSRLLDLTCGKAVSLLREFGDILGDPKQPEFEVLNSLDVSMSIWLEIFVELTLAAACEFHRRVVRYIGDFPFKVFQLLREPPSFPSAARADLALELLGLHTQSGNKLDGFSLKFSIAFAPQLGQVAVSGGVMPHWFADMMAIVANAWPTDTSEQESTNSVIKVLIKRAPAISTELLAARIVIRKSFRQQIFESKSAREIVARGAVEYHCAAKTLWRPLAKLFLVSQFLLPQSSSSSSLFSSFSAGSLLRSCVGACACGFWLSLFILAALLV
jgi:hypothetical protein